ncbi:DNA adenine methylase [Neisseria montereyensis]|uniref:site-specific DNA-methyltransferase (adenine-specific) n=1 Tax=Neisseria montereyensis TaxID=2973938 RepID=A0ABT2FDW6_9NEIS|nr:DNA adenine methylase [Neisseria montereyensis]MCS4534337.1 DNA adenine methylase [Neisseria montereyensis]
MAGHSKPLTPLRYPGGKGAFAPFVKSVIEANDLKGGHYLEPFAGGAGVALDLLFNGYASDIHINDADPAIYHFWRSMVKDTDNFLRLLEQTPLNINEWEHQKNILNQPDNYSSLEHGFAAFYLNRTNRSGILKAGVIGGKAQNGTYKLDARFNKVRLASLITRIAKYSASIHIYHLDALDLLGQVDDLLPPQSLAYLDPPYYVKGQGLYRNFYNHDDHVAICQALATINTPWIVSYDNCDEIKEIYKDYRQDEYFLAYCAYKKTKGSEVMIYSDSINIPARK